MADEERYEKTFATGDHCELTLVNVRGQVQITGWERPEVSVVAVKRMGHYWGGQESFQNTTVEMDQQGAAVSLRTRMARTFNPFGWMGIGATPPEVEYTVQVPVKSEVAVRTVGGLVQIAHVQGTVYARAVSGDIFLEKVAGNLIVHGVSGQVKAQEGSGNLGVRTVSGDVAVRQSRLESLAGKTVSGDIALESSLAVRGSYTAKTVSGDCRLFLPADTRANIQLTSTSGKAKCDLPCIVNEMHRGLWRGTLNGGGATVSVHSVSGDLIIGRGEEAGTRGAGELESPPAGEAAEAPESQESPEMAVLRAVEHGEMSVEQALQQLEEFMG